jgi:ABC-type sugar transport system substrate-binding protein
MKRAHGAQAALLAAAALAGCASAAGDARAARALDPQHIARVEQDARHNAKTILWINPPPQRPVTGVAP